MALNVSRHVTHKSKKSIGNLTRFHSFTIKKTFMGERKEAAEAI